MRRPDATLDAPLLTGRETASQLAVSGSNAGDAVRAMSVPVPRAIAPAPGWVTPAAPLISSPVESRVLPSVIPAQREREAAEHRESPRFASLARRAGPDGIPERASHSSWNKEGPTRNIAVRPEESLRSLRSRASTADVLLAPVNASMVAPTIEVHIGRIEIRTPSAASKPATASSAANHEKSLAAHLWTRSRGARS